MRFWRRSEGSEIDTDVRLVVGLGNPGARYTDTRHNVGFMVVQTLARRHDLTFRSSKHRAEVARGAIDGVPVLLALPLTYMNESGNAVQRLVAYYRISLSRLLVVYDEIDLPFGTVRLRPSGSSAGHRGLASIIQMLGSEDFARLRVGVGRPESSAIGHVLSPFTAEQVSMLPGLIDISADAVTAWLTTDVKDAMNRFNRDWLPVLRPGPAAGDGQASRSGESGLQQS